MTVNKKLFEVKLLILNLFSHWVKASKLMNLEMVNSFCYVALFLKKYPSLFLIKVCSFKMCQSLKSVFIVA